MERRIGDWMLTASGRAFWPIDPRPSEVFIEDIAHSLAHQCRFAGHCRWHYSVAQHSVLVASHLPEELRLWGLLHDASEAYVVDVPKPLKRYLIGYAEIEDNVLAAIAERFGLRGSIPIEVKRVDSAILADETAQLMADPPRDWHLPFPPLGVEIVPMTPEVASQAYLDAFRNIQGG